jgi:hypothetical protein
MEKNPKSTEPQTPPRKKKFQLKRSFKSAPGPGGSQESERTQYHEEPARREVENMITILKRNWRIKHK